MSGGRASGKAQVTSHLKTFPSEQRKVLESLRAMISNEIPSAEQVIKYGIPTFVLDGVPIIGFNGYKKHNSIFPYSGSVGSRLEKELEKYEQTKGSIHFPRESNIPLPLLRKILKAKFQDLAERAK